MHYVPTQKHSLRGNPDDDLLGSGVEARYRFMPEGRLVPFSLRAWAVPTTKDPGNRRVEAAAEYMK